MSLEVKKIYVDSRFRTKNSVSDSNFSIQLGRNIYLPENTVSGLKRKKIASAAAAFTESKHYQGDIRFDIIGIVYDGQHNHEIRHFPDAFFPGLF